MKITDQMFDEKLMEILSRMRASALLQIEGIYEIVSEHFNNEVIEEIEMESEENQ